MSSKWRTAAARVPTRRRGRGLEGFSELHYSPREVSGGGGRDPAAERWRVGLAMGASGVEAAVGRRKKLDEEEDDG